MSDEEKTFINLILKVANDFLKGRGFLVEIEEKRSNWYKVFFFRNRTQSYINIEFFTFSGDSTAEFASYDTTHFGFKTKDQFSKFMELNTDNARFEPIPSRHDPHRKIITLDIWSRIDKLASIAAALANDRR